MDTLAPMNLNRSVGVKTLPRFHKPDARTPARLLELQPDLAGQTVEQLVRSIQSVGANLGELRLDYRKAHGRLPPDDRPQIAEWPAYISAVFKPAAHRTDRERQIVESTQQMISDNLFTRRQQKDIILEFLRRVAAASPADAAPVRFLLADLVWFQAFDPSKRGQEASREEALESSSARMAEIIGAARAECIDYLIAGAFIFEPANRDMPDLVQVIQEFARRLNMKTSGWLSRRGALLFSGGGWGADYSGLSMVNSDDFFDRVSRHSASFAFAYKLMQFNKDGYLDGDMLSRVCEARRLPCATPEQKQAVKSSEAYWLYYLNELAGFRELAAFVNGKGADATENRKQYPAHANVVFVGDNSDSLATSVGNGPSIEPETSLRALSKLWISAARDGTATISRNWSGKSFMELFDERHTGRDGFRHGRSLFLVGQADRDSKTQLVTRNDYEIGLWRTWPEVPE